MIASFMLYGTAVAVLLSLAALAAERALGALGKSRRGVWALALLGSLAFPTFMVLDEPTRPDASGAMSFEPIAGSSTEPAIEALAPRVVDASTPATLSVLQLSFPLLDRFLTVSWAVASVSLLLYFAIGAFLTRRRLRSAHRGTVAGHSVMISEDMGPAVVGFVKPSVVVPRWLLERPLAMQSLVLDHERQHVAAKDQHLLLLALLVLVIAPWNLPLWWQMRRLRFAIEVDCDARVLRGGADVVTYGEVLLQVSRHWLRAPAAAVALIEPPSDLERRIRIITSTRGRHVALAAGACLAACASLVAVAAQIDAPRVTSPDLRMPPPGATLPARVKAVVRKAHPELFDPGRAQPALVKVVLNNDLSVEWSDVKLLPIGTTQEATAAEQPKAAVLARLHPDEPRIAGELLIQEGVDSPPVFLTYSVHMYHESRSPAAVERALRAKYPELYDDAADADLLLIALMRTDGSVERMMQRPRGPDESFIGEGNQRNTFKELNTGTSDIGVLGLIGSSTQARFRPTVLYAFPKSGQQRIDANPTQPIDRGRMTATGRALVERHFPEIADGSANPHELLWILLDQTGEVVATGRDASSPEPLMVNLERHYPGAATSNRLTTSLSALFGKDMRDTQGQPLLVTLAWLDGHEGERARGASNAQSIELDATLYRNGTLVSSSPMTLAVGKPFTHTTEQLRLDITALDVGRDMIDFGVVMRVPVDQSGVEFAERWEIVSQPMLRTKIGAAATIEQGVSYPGKAGVEGNVVWRVSLTPRRAI